MNVLKRYSQSGPLTGMSIHNSDEDTSDTGQRGSSRKRESIVGIASGIIHGAVAIALWSFFGFENLLELPTVEPLYFTYIVVGMFALGFIPGLLYTKWNAVSPSILIGGLLCLSSYGTWQAIGAGATPVDPTPFGWYTLLWVAVVAVASVLAWMEIKFVR